MWVECHKSPNGDRRAARMVGMTIRDRWITWRRHLWSNIREAPEVAAMVLLLTAVIVVYIVVR